MSRNKELILGGSSKVGLNLIHAMKNEGILYTYYNNEIPINIEYE